MRVNAHNVSRRDALCVNWALGAMYKFSFLLTYLLAYLLTLQNDEEHIGAGRRYQRIIRRRRNDALHSIESLQYGRAAQMAGGSHFMFTTCSAIFLLLTTLLFRDLFVILLAGSTIVVQYNSQ